MITNRSHKEYFIGVYLLPLWGEMEERSSIIISLIKNLKTTKIPTQHQLLQLESARRKLYCFNKPKIKKDIGFFYSYNVTCFFLKSEQ